MFVQLRGNEARKHSGESVGFFFFKLLIEYAIIEIISRIFALLRMACLIGEMLQEYCTFI